MSTRYAFVVSRRKAVYDETLRLPISFTKSPRKSMLRVPKFLQKDTSPLLGSLEREVMQAVWNHGESSVRDVAPQLSRPLAYTTVMTTLDRLHKKGLLNRSMKERAYYYSPRFSRPEWDRLCADHLVSGFLGGPDTSRELLVSCLLDAVVAHDEKLLDEMEEKIRARREDLKRGKSL